MGLKDYYQNIASFLPRGGYWVPQDQIPTCIYTTWETFVLSQTD